MLPLHGASPPTLICLRIGIRWENELTCTRPCRPCVVDEIATHDPSPLVAAQVVLLSAAVVNGKLAVFEVRANESQWKLGSKAIKALRKSFKA